MATPSTQKAWLFPEALPFIALPTVVIAIYGTIKTVLLPATAQCGKSGTGERHDGKRIYGSASVSIPDRFCASGKAGATDSAIAESQDRARYDPTQFSAEA